MYPILLCVILIFLVLLFGFVFFQYKFNKENIHTINYTTESPFINRRKKYESKEFALVREKKLVEERLHVIEMERKEKKDRKNRKHRRQIKLQKKKELKDAEELERQKQRRQDKYCL